MAQSLKITLLLFVFSCNLFSQDWTLPLTGKVEKNDKKLQGAIVTLMQGSKQIAQTLTGEDGAFKFEIPANGDFMITVTKPGHCTKKFQVSTRGVPPDDKSTKRFDIPGINLFEPLPNIDYSVLNQPLVKIQYSATKQVFDYDEAYFSQSLAALDKLKQLEADAINKQKELEFNYSSAIKTADKAFQKKDWATAKANYSNAIKFKPAENYPKDQLAQIDIIIKDQEALNKKSADDLAAKASADKAAADALAKKKADEETARLAKEKADKLAADKAAADKVAADAKAKADADALAKKKADEDAARLAKEKTDKLAADKAAADKVAADAKAKADADALAKKKADEETARLAKEKADKLAADKAAADKVAADAKAKADADALAKKKADEETARLAKEKADKLAADKAAADKIAADAKAKADADALAKKKADEDAARLAKEKADKEIADAKAKGDSEAARLAKEKADKATADAKAKADADALAKKKADEDAARLAKEKSKLSTLPPLGVDKYKEAIKRADELFKMKRYNEAKTTYEEALVAKASDAYAKSRLVEIEKLLKSDTATAESTNSRMKELLAKYPPGVHESTISGTGVVIIQRVVAKETIVYIYQKKIFNWGGVSYFRDGTAITESTFEQETKP
jgi:hypothetical protein